MARIGEEFPLQCPGCGGDIRLIAFHRFTSAKPSLAFALLATSGCCGHPVRDPGPILKILMHLGEAIEPPPVSAARGPPTDRGELVQADDDRDVFQPAPDNLPVIDIHSL
jgi:hypothetical protein